MITKDQILITAKNKGKLYSKDLAKQFKVSRQYISLLISELVVENKLIKLGSTRRAFYVLPEYAQAHQEIFPLRYVKTFKNEGLEEHKVLNQIEETFPILKNFSENIRSIFIYAFSEILNNAIEHSKSVRVGVEVSVPNKTLSFIIQDSGIGVFLLDILEYQLIEKNKTPDVFIKTVKKIKKGTRAMFKISVASERHLSEIFKKYTNLVGENDYGFDKTEIRVKLYTISGVHISRSQARRVLSGLEKFKIIVFDFDRVPTVGQAFADEVFRVFHHKYPNIKLETENMAEGVKFMVERAQNEAEIKK